MIRLSFYLSVVKDPDLCGFLNDVGTNRFRDIARLCLKALFDKDAAKQALLKAGSIQVEDNKKLPVFFNGNTRIRLVINEKKDEAVSNLLQSIKSQCRSLFVKNTIRQVLGPQILLKYYLKEGAESFFAESVYVPVKTIRVLVEDTGKEEFSVSSHNSYSVSNRNKKSDKPIVSPSFDRTQNNNYDSTLREQGLKDEARELEQNNSSLFVSNQTPPLPLVQDDFGFSELNGASEDNTNDTQEDEFDVLSMLEAML